MEVLNEQAVRAFWDWVDREAGARSLSIREMERIGLEKIEGKVERTGRIHSARTKNIQPSAESCVIVAEGLGIGRLEVFSRAGWIEGETSDLSFHEAIGQMLKLMKVQQGDTTQTEEDRAGYKVGGISDLASQIVAVVETLSDTDKQEVLQFAGFRQLANDPELLEMVRKALNSNPHGRTRLVEAYRKSLVGG